jgi:hypothetical protein
MQTSPICPTVGTTVLYTYPEPAPRISAAIVTHVWGDGVCNLVAFVDDGAGPAIKKVVGAKRSGSFLPGTWSWPEDRS